jgi:hypothetical protein
VVPYTSNPERFVILENLDGVVKLGECIWGINDAYTFNQEHPRGDDLTFS